ncbi:MAG: hypothetical protein IKH76_01420, partial [Clostridiales bacterium]|nr:hypothetical protein [Clostridiales bacterium]
YGSDNKPEFLYANMDVTKVGSGAKGLLWLILFVPLLIFLILGFSKTMFDIPVKLGSYPDTKIVIDDRTGILSPVEEENLRDKFEVFQYKTNITPAMITVNNEDWNKNYTSLENYAYDLYVNTFDDESHWLFVYSQPVNKTSGFVDWYWEGMQGDLTDKILTPGKTTRFNNNVQRKLLKDDYTVGDAFAEAVNELSGTVMEVNVNWFLMPFALIALGIVGLCAFFVIDYHPFRAKKFRKMVDCSGEVIRQEACEYCGGTYVVGHHTSCPYCAAPVRPHDLAVDGEGRITGIIK